MKMYFKNLSKTLLPFIILIAASFSLYSQTLPSDILTNLNSYNVVWNSASTTGSAGSMPLGNGDITLNVWVEENGDLMLYLGKSDNWSEGTRLLKTGRVRISLSPNPFASGIPFQQVLNLYKGEINITAGAPGSAINLKVWVDANNPVIHVEAKGDQAFSMKCTSEIMRLAPFTLSSSTDPLADSFRGVIEGNIKPTESADKVISKANEIGWYHRNANSMFSTILENENLGGYTNSFPDPFIDRTFGAIIKGTGLNKADDFTLQSTEDLSDYSLSIYSFTSQTSTVEEWINQIESKISETEAIPIADAYKSHCVWWDNFWNRSWIFISGDANATSVTRAYLLQRFMMACMGRGQHPMKFNGGTLTFDYQDKDADYRRWGPGYWNQNTRHLYWPMLAAGDYDLMLPWFDCYMKMIDIQKAHTQTLYNHEGAFFPETFNFFGLNILDDWGWGNTDIKTTNPYIRYHYSGALEVISQMLDYYYFTKDPTFIEKYIVPFSTEVIRFLDQHYPRENGKIKFYPSNAIETYWDCTNPTDLIAGLKYTIPILSSLPGDYITQELKDEWQNCFNSLPPIAFDSIEMQIKPAELYGDPNNSENPDCYTIFPFKIYGNSRDNIDIGVQTFGNRRIKASTCWAPDPIWSALVGISDIAAKDIISNAKSLDANVRFPAFWTPRNDYIPDFDNGGALMMGLQSMLIQNVDSQILVLPAWPSNWNVDFKLQAYDNTTIRLISQGQTIEQMEASPSSRLDDIVLSNGKQNQSILFPSFEDSRPGANITLKASVSSGLPITYTSSDTAVATIIGSSIHAVGFGSAIITAYQPGDGNFNASTKISRKFTVTSIIEAEDFYRHKGTKGEICSEGGADITSIKEGDYTSYNNINLTGATSIDLRIASNKTVGEYAGNIEIRTGSATGPLIGSVTVPGTGGSQIWSTISCPINKTTGGVVLFLVYTNNPEFSVNWLQIILSPTSIKSINGELLQGLKLFPNPTDKECWVELTNPGVLSSDVRINIFSVLGKLIKSEKHISNPGVCQVYFDTSNLISGVYMVDCLWDNGIRKTEKLLIK